MKNLILLVLGFTFNQSVFAAPSVVGTWELESFIRITDSGKELSWCKNVHGLLTYSPDGFMSAAINCAEDTPSDAPSQPYGNKLLYAGTYWMDGPSTVVHSVKNASDLTMIGRKLPRTIKSISDTKLVLTGRASNGKGGFNIVWKRAKSQRN